MQGSRRAALKRITRQMGLPCCRLNLKRTIAAGTTAKREGTERQVMSGCNLWHSFVKISQISLVKSAAMLEENNNVQRY